MSMEVLLRLLAMLAVLLLGTGLRAGGLLTASRTGRLNAAAYYIALPALVFVATYEQSIGELLSPSLLVGLLVVLYGTAALAWIVHRNEAAAERRSVAVVQSYHSNLGYLGLPLVAATFDPTVTAIATLVLGIGSLAQLPLTVFILSTVNGANATVRSELTALAKNPVLLALIIGLISGAVGLTLPTTADIGLEALAALALPMALLSVGASLEVDLPSVNLGAVGTVTAVKVACMPAVAWVVFSLLAVDSATFTAAVVMFGTPTAVSTYVFASELGGDERFASLNVFVTTVVSIGTLFVVISLVG